MNPTTLRLILITMHSALALLTGCAAPELSTMGIDTQMQTRDSKHITLADGSAATVSAISTRPHDDPRPDHTGPSILYVHGSPGSADGWSRYLKDPVADLPAIAIDRLGYGGSNKDRAYQSLADQASAVAAWFPDQGDIILVGHSLGGPIVAQAALDHPDKVAAIVILAGALDPTLERVMTIQRIAANTHVRKVLPAWLRNANEELMPLEGELNQLGPELHRIMCPIVVVHGTNDRLVPYDNLEFMRERFGTNRHAEYVSLDGEGHFIPWRRETEVRAAIERALELAGYSRAAIGNTTGLR